MSKRDETKTIYEDHNIAAIVISHASQLEALLPLQGLLAQKDVIFITPQGAGYYLGIPALLNFKKAVQEQLGCQLLIDCGSSLAYAYTYLAQESSWVGIHMPFPSHLETAIASGSQLFFFQGHQTAMWRTSPTARETKDLGQEYYQPNYHLAQFSFLDLSGPALFSLAKLKDWLEALPC